MIRVMKLDGIKANAIETKNTKVPSELVLLIVFCSYVSGIGMFNP